MQQLLLDESGKWHYTGKDKARRLEITFEPIDSKSLPKSLLLKGTKIPPLVTCFKIQVTKEISLEGNIYMDFDKLSKKDAEDFCKEVTNAWKESLRNGSVMSVPHIEKTCEKKFKGYHFRIFHSENLYKESRGNFIHFVRYLDSNPTIVGTNSHTYYDPVLSTHTIPVPFSATQKHSSSFFN